jgi:hypothetical protein
MYLRWKLFHAISKATSKLYMYSYKIPSDNELTEKTLRMFETTVHDTIHFDDDIFNTCRGPNRRYHIEHINLYRMMMDRFRIAYVKLFRRDFARMVVEDPRMRKLVHNNLEGLRSIYEDELLRDFCEVVHLRRVLGITGFNMNYKEELTELRNRIAMLSTEQHQAIVRQYQSSGDTVNGGHCPPQVFTLGPDSVRSVNGGHCPPQVFTLGPDAVRPVDVSGTIRCSMTVAELEDCRRIIGPNLVNLISTNTARQVIIDDLLSDQAVPPWCLSILSDYLNFDMYILQDENLIRGNPKNSPLYGGSELHRYVQGPIVGKRNAIVITSYNNSHYELIGRVDIQSDETKSCTVMFNQDEPLIVKLYDNLSETRLRSPEQILK